MSKHQLRFEHIDNLHLLDLKAQKKNVNYKRFFNLPLSFEETIAAKIKDPPQTEHHNSTDHLFKIKKHKKIAFKKLDQLSHPRRFEEFQPSSSTGNLLNIIEKCDRLKGKLITHKKLSRFQKDAGKCYDYLFELSSFNFQKFEND